MNGGTVVEVNRKSVPTLFVRSIGDIPAPRIEQLCRLIDAAPVRRILPDGSCRMPFAAVQAAAAAANATSSEVAPSACSVGKMTSLLPPKFPCPAFSAGQVVPGQSAM